MAWLQNLAGHAENLLNKIDQNAATVLNDGNKQNTEDEEKGRDYYYDPEQVVRGPTVIKPLIGPVNVSRSSSPELPAQLIDEKTTDNFLVVSENQQSISSTDENRTEQSNKSDETSLFNTIQENFITSQEVENLQSKIAKLEMENQDINKQLLNIQHLYSEMRNENTSLQFQVERLNEQLTLAQSEKDQYVARAQRILQEKEKLIGIKQASGGTEDNESNIFTMYNEEMKKELEFQQAKVADLTEKNAKLLSDLQSLQMQHQVIQQGLSQSNQSLEQSLLNEKKHRLMAEEDCVQKTKELEVRNQEIVQLHGVIRRTNEESAKLKEALHRKAEHYENDEYETRVKSLTQTLMVKQNKLETVTTERNALRLQLEKLEAEYKKNIAELKRDRVKIVNVQDTSDDAVFVPNFMRVSPHDAGVTRRVKHAYSTLDAISVRSGIFLRRYPLARVFVFSYMVILHFWVFTVLLWDVPSN